MIELALSLLLSASLLLNNVQANPNVNPELRQKAEDVATLAINFAQQALGDSAVSLQDAPGQSFTPLQGPGAISTQDTATESVSLAFTVSPIVEYVSTSTSSGSGFPDTNYNIHFETNLPAIADFSIYGSNKQGIYIPATSFDLKVTNIWGMQVPFLLDVRTLDSSQELDVTGVLKG